jgi:hypothetical protein
MFQSKAGYIDARPLTVNSSKTSCNARPDHTLGSFSALSIAGWRDSYNHHNTNADGRRGRDGPTTDSYTATWA